MISYYCVVIDDSTSIEDTILTHTRIGIYECAMNNYGTCADLGMA